MVIRVHLIYSDPYVFHIYYRLVALASHLRYRFIVACALPSPSSVMAAQARAAPKWSEAYFACLGSGMEGFQRGGGIRITAMCRCRERARSGCHSQRR